MIEFVPEAIIPKGAEVYHYSRSVDELVASGYFDPTRTRHEGAMHLTTAPNIRTNCSATTAENLTVFDLGSISEVETDQLEERGGGSFWDGATELGFDGMLFYARDAFTLKSNGSYGEMLVVFRSSLSKLIDIKPIQSKPEIEKLVH